MGDALRAKRAMEQYEREWRQKERAAIEKRKMQNKILHEARVQQKKEKERRLESVAKAERAEFDRIVQVQKEIEKEKKHLVEIKDRKIHELRNSGVPGKYL